MKISCIIPTCNRNKYLIEAINSVLAQTLLPNEIIIVNNGEGEVKIPDNINQKVKIYNIIHFAGAAQARNFGASLASGDYLAFLDDDDYWSNKYIENVSVAIKNGAKCVLSCINLIKNGKVISQKNPHNRINLDNLLVHNPGAGGPNIVIEKETFFKVKGFDAKLTTSEDKSLIIELINNNVHVETLPDNYVFASRDTGVKRLTDAATIAEGISQFIKKYADLMNKKQYLYNLSKIYYYRYKSGKKIAFFKYCILKLINYFIS